MSRQLTDQQQEEVRTALAMSKIEAVRIYKGFTGASLLESKKFVESLTKGGEDSSPASDGLSSEQMDEILDHLGQGNKLAASKAYRRLSGLGLRDSKVFIETLIEKLQLDLPLSLIHI